MLVIINESVKKIPTKRKKKNNKDSDSTVKLLYFLVIDKLTSPKGCIVKGTAILP